MCVVCTRKQFWNEKNLPLFRSQCPQAMCGRFRFSVHFLCLFSPFANKLSPSCLTVAILSPLCLRNLFPGPRQRESTQLPSPFPLPIKLVQSTKNDESSLRLHPEQMNSCPPTAERRFLSFQFISTHNSLSLMDSSVCRRDWRTSAVETDF